ncbi:MAG: hypothetical protein ACFCU9_16080 [Cyanophyceae cyanobacterium]
MRLFKALFGGIAAFLGILFGGLVDNLTGAFKEDAEPAPMMATAQAAPTSTQSMGSPEKPVSASTVPEVGPVVVATSAAPSNSSQLRSQPTVAFVVTTPFVPNEVASPRPRRRPGKTMGSFMEMAREIPSASRRG